MDKFGSWHSDKLQFQIQIFGFDKNSFFTCTTVKERERERERVTARENDIECKG